MSAETSRIRARLGGVWYRLQALLRPAAHARALHEELRFHLELDAAQLRHTSVSAARAHFAARRRLGSVIRIAEEVREMSLRQWIDDFVQDVRYAARGLRRSPAFAFGAALTLALGIGATAAMFSVVSAVLLRALPYKDAGRLIAVWTADPKAAGEPFTTSPPDFRELATATHSIEAIAAHYITEVAVSDGGGPERMRAARVSVSLFNVLGASPHPGRGFVAEESTWGHQRVVVISDGLWRQRYGADPRVVGRTLTIDREPYEVIGVAPPALRFPDPSVELWMPMAFAPGATQDTRGNYFLQIVARLRDGVSVDDAHRELAAVARRVAAEHPDALMRDVVVRPLRDDIVGDAGRPLLVLGGAIVLVLLVACANVAALLLARGESRRAEVALRTSLGAERGRIVRQLIAESLVLSTGGGLLGVLLAAGLVALVVRYAPSELPRLHEVSVDGRTVAACAALALATALVFGLAPALRLSRAKVADALRDRSRTATGRRGHRVYTALVAGQMALSVVLLAGAGLLLRSFEKVMRADPGFRADHLLTMALPIAGDAYPTAEREAQLADAVLVRARALAGVRAAATMSGLSLVGGWWGKQVSVEGRPAPVSLEQVPSVGYRVVTRDYFTTMGVALRRGRAFGADDRRGGPPVAVINETMARRFFPGENPLGRTIWLGPPESLLGEHLASGFRFPRLTVIGVAVDERFEALDGPAGPEVYQLLEQVDERPPDLYLAVRAAGNPAALAASMRAAVREVDPLLPVADVATMTERVDRAMGERRFTLELLGGFALVAVILAAVGLYGVIAYSVAERRREFAVRLALGGTSRAVLGLVVGHAMRPVLFGTGAGLLGAVALAGLVRVLLYGVSPTDPIALSAAVVVLFVAALLASAGPAWRATRVGLAEALRAD